MKCHFCPQGWEPEAAASANATATVPPGGDPFEHSTKAARTCPSCFKKALVHGTWVGGFKEPGKAISLCFKCGIPKAATPGDY